MQVIHLFKCRIDLEERLKQRLLFVLIERLISNLLEAAQSYGLSVVVVDLSVGMKSPRSCMPRIQSFCIGSVSVGILVLIAELNPNLVTTDANSDRAAILFFVEDIFVVRHLLLVLVSNNSNAVLVDRVRTSLGRLFACKRLRFIQIFHQFHNPTLGTDGIQRASDVSFHGNCRELVMVDRIQDVGEVILLHPVDFLDEPVELINLKHNVFVGMQDKRIFMLADNIDDVFLHNDHNSTSYSCK